MLDAAGAVRQIRKYAVCRGENRTRGIEPQEGSCDSIHGNGGLRRDGQYRHGYAMGSALTEKTLLSKMYSMIDLNAVPTYRTWR